MDFVELNRVRVKYKLKLVLCSLITIIGFVGGFSLTIIFDEGFIVGGIIIAVIFIILAIKTNNNAKKYFKEEIILDLVKREFIGGQYNPKSGVDEAEVIINGFFTSPDLYQTEDLIIANYNGLDFYMSDFSLLKLNGYQKNKSYYKYAGGKIVVVEFESSIPDIKVVDVLNDIYKSSSNLIPTDNNVFNEFFNVYSLSDNIFNLLNDRLTKYLNYLKTTTNGKIYFALRDNKVYLIIDDKKDGLEVSVFKEINEEVIKGLKQELKIVKELINILKDDDFSIF